MYGGRTQDRTRKYADHANWPDPKLVMQRAEETSQATIPVFITVSCLKDSQHIPAASRLGSNGQVTPRPYDVFLATATQDRQPRLGIRTPGGPGSRLHCINAEHTQGPSRPRSRHLVMMTRVAKDAACTSPDMAAGQRASCSVSRQATSRFAKVFTFLDGLSLQRLGDDPLDGPPVGIPISGDRC
jgi:hypothetical protein